MENRQQNNKRIAKNSIFLLLRMILLTLVSLYTSRVVLHSLGASDYGLYNVVGGIVGHMVGIFVFFDVHSKPCAFNIPTHNILCINIIGERFT